MKPQQVAPQKAPTDGSAASRPVPTSDAARTARIAGFHEARRLSAATATPSARPPARLRTQSSAENLSAAPVPGWIPAPPEGADEPASPAPTAAPGGWGTPRRTAQGSAKSWPKGLDFALLGVVAVIALALRLKEPLSSSIMGAEDSYRHVERVWDLVQGRGLGDYPPGLTLLLVPFTLLGPSGFYDVARFIPSVFGVGMVVAVFFLVRPYAHPAGALTASLLVAAMPEMVRRTDVLFPTALDLAILPVLFLFVLRASEGSQRSLIGVAIIGALLLAIHPWVMGLLVAPLVLFWVLMAAKKEGLVTLRDRLGWRGGVAAAMFAVGVGALQVLHLGPTSAPVRDHALPKLAQLASNPASITPLPLYVDLPEMLTLAALALAGIGAVVAVTRRNRFGLLALLWSALLLPVVFVDWLGLWYIPHRAVAYLGIGIAMLAAVAVSELFKLLADSNKAQLPIGVGFAVLLLAFVVPAGAAIDPWYRIYDKEDHEAWHALDEMDTEYVMAASWQARMGYRAVTARPAEYNPDFFDREEVRDFELLQNPGLVVVVDAHAVEAGTNTTFLEDWDLIGQWGSTRAYVR